MANKSQQPLKAGTLTQCVLDIFLGWSIPVIKKPILVYFKIDAVTDKPPN